MRALLTDPYLDTLGGGERYILTLAEFLLSKNWHVDLTPATSDIIYRATRRFGLDLANTTPRRINQNFISKLFNQPQYDLSFTISDGSIPFLFAKVNWLHFQVPFHHVNGQRLLNRIKFRQINRIIVNSQFTKRYIDQEYGTNSQIVYPPVDFSGLTRATVKKPLILTVARFSNLMQQKRPDILIKAFRQIHRQLPTWRFVLAGGTDVGTPDSYLQSLKKLAQGLPVDFVLNPPVATLHRLYRQARIFWTASGYGVDEAKQPHQVEHFGITLVESMGAGCLPLVVAKGGFKEILGGQLSSLLWNTPDQLVEKTVALIQTPQLENQLKQRALAFSKEQFTINIDRLLKDDI